MCFRKKEYIPEIEDAILKCHDCGAVDDKEAWEIIEMAYKYQKTGKFYIDELFRLAELYERDHMDKEAFRKQIKILFNKVKE